MAEMNITSSGTYKIEKNFTGTITIATSSAVTLDGTNAGNLNNVKIITNSNVADLTIKNLTVTNNRDSVICFGDGMSNKLTLIGTNKLKTSDTWASVVLVGGGLTINGTGSLDVPPGSQGSGIGANSYATSNANITINGGKIIATSDLGAGIGSGSNGSIGNITINAVSVNATSNWGKDIGAGYYGSAGKVSITIVGDTSDDVLVGTSGTDTFAYTSGNDVITNYGHEDTVHIRTGKIDGYSFDGSDLIFKIGSGSLRLNNMTNHAITVKDSSGNTTTKIYGTGYSGHEVMKRFVHSMSNSKLDTKLRLDEAIRTCSHFNSLQEVINQLINNLNTTGDAETFLKKYCGIFLDNADTGAVTGWDAGGLYFKTKDDLLPKKGSASYPASTTFTKRGLTLTVPEKSSLTEKEQLVIQGLYSWWLGDAIKLIEDAYGLKFTEKPLAINFSFKYEPNESYWALGGSELILNMSHTNFDASDKSGNGLDAVFSHELTHVMQYNFNSFDTGFLVEAIANFTKGLDYQYSTVENMREIASSASKLAKGLNSNNADAGMIFLRYLMRQASDSYTTIVGGSTSSTLMTVTNTNKSPVTIDSAVKTVDASSRTTAVKITGNSLENSIVGGSGSDTLSGASGNGNDLFVYSAGKDVITDYATGDKISLGAAVSKATVSGSDVVFTLGSGSLTVKNSKGKSLNMIDKSGKAYTTIVGGSTSSTLMTVTNATKSPVTIDSAVKTVNASSRTTAVKITGNSLANSIVGGKAADTLWGGTGNDTLTGGNGNDLFVYSAGKDVITDYATGDKISLAAAVSKETVSGSDVVFTVGSGSLTVKNAKGKSLSLIDKSGKAYTTIVGGSTSSTLMTVTNATKSPVTIDSAVKIVDASSRTTAVKITGNSLENSIVGGKAADTLWGGTGNDTLTGGNGNDLFVYSAGKDVITDYATGDKISLGAAVSKATVSGSDVVFTVGSGSLTVKNAKGKSLNMIDKSGKAYTTIVGGSTSSTLMTVTNAIKSPVTIDSAVKTVNASSRTTTVKITGNSLENSIVGGSGSDTLSGASGNDTLTGGNGNDLFVYSAGKDVITDYATGDKISLGAAVSKATVSGSDVVFTLGSGSLTVKNAKGKSLNMIDKSGKAYTTIVGGSTSSTLMTVTNATKSPVTIDSAVKIVDASARIIVVKITGNSEPNTILGGAENDTLLGNFGADYLNGLYGDDKLYGGTGNDTLIGNGGNDSLWGEGGNDTFIYGADDGKDVIVGFESNDLLKITGTFSATYNPLERNVSFKVDSTANAITLKDFTATSFNINGDVYQISGSKLVKK